MNIPKKPAMIGGGILAFVLAVVVMVPPTKPLGGAKVDPDAHHGPADLPPPKKQPVARPIEQVAPAAPPEGFSGDAANIASTAGMREADYDDAGYDSDAPAPMRDRPVAAERYAQRQDVRDPRADERDYQFGYRWAAERQVEDPRQCRAFEGTPRGDGCFAFLRDADR